MPITIKQLREISTTNKKRKKNEKQKKYNNKHRGNCIAIE